MGDVVDVQMLVVVAVIVLVQIAVVAMVSSEVVVRVVVLVQVVVGHRERAEEQWWGHLWAARSTTRRLHINPFPWKVVVYFRKKRNLVTLVSFIQKGKKLGRMALVIC